MSSACASFFLPGLVHQFGNLLLTVQGHVLQATQDNLTAVQDVVSQQVQRGGASLEVVRALLGDDTGTPRVAQELLAQLAELGRVPARERGVTLELRGQPPRQHIYVVGDVFLRGCAAAIRSWMTSLAPGAAGAVTLAMRGAGDGGVVVDIGFEPAEGTLPFPLEPESTVEGIAAAMARALGRAVARADGTGVELRFPPAGETFVAEA
ncbi:MAG TPA: hypothetical protein ENI87_00615 [bacterium]|nr:hypothetical protein [bacterium]